MADTRPVDLALTTERPALPEVVGVLAACAVVFVLLVHFDGTAARHETERARDELARRAAETRAQQPREQRPANADIGAAGPISVPVGPAWSSGTSASAAHAAPADDGGAPPAGVLALLAVAGAMMIASGAFLLYRAS